MATAAGQPWQTHGAQASQPLPRSAGPTFTSLLRAQPPLRTSPSEYSKGATCSTVNMAAGTSSRCRRHPSSIPAAECAMRTAHANPCSTLARLRIWRASSCSFACLLMCRNLVCQPGSTSAGSGPGWQLERFMGISGQERNSYLHRWQAVRFAAAQVIVREWPSCKGSPSGLLTMQAMLLLPRCRASQQVSEHARARMIIHSRSFFHASSLWQVAQL